MQPHCAALGLCENFRPQFFQRLGAEDCFVEIVDRTCVAFILAMGKFFLHKRFVRARKELRVTKAANASFPCGLTTVSQGVNESLPPGV